MKLRSVLVALDLSPTSVAALNRARTLVEPGGRLHLLHVVEPAVETAAPRHSTPGELEQHRHRVQDQARVRLGELARGLTEAGIATAVEVVFGRPGAEILAASTRIGPDLVAVGSHGKNVFDSALLGSVAEEVARRGDAPTLVVHESPSHSTVVERVVVATDLQETSRDAAEAASAVARRLAKPLEAVHVIDFGDLPLSVTGSFDPNVLSEETRRVVEGAPKAVERALLDAGVVRAAIKVIGGAPSTELAKYVTDRDLLVCGTHARGALGRLVHGSVAVHLLRHATCPVLVVRPRSASVAASL